MRKLITMAAVFAGVVLAFAGGPARASNVSSEITDMWWTPAESGWGVNVVLQGDVAFATFFLYDTARKPVWYTAQLTKQGNAFVWSGGLYATNGPWFGPVQSGVRIRPYGWQRSL